jgi:shikimate kinase
VSCRSLFLIGYRGTGKTSVAERLASRVGWPWIDADSLIEQRAGQSISSIFAREGERRFRELEEQVVQSLCQRDRVVVALGGGAVLRKSSCELVKNSGTVVWLQATPATLFDRICQDVTTGTRRPNLTHLGGLAEIEQVLAAREPIYAACAHMKVNTEGKTPDEIAEEIYTSLQGRL